MCGPLEVSAASQSDDRGTPVEPRKIQFENETEDGIDLPAWLQ